MKPSERIDQITNESLAHNPSFNTEQMLMARCAAIAQVLDETGLVKTDEGWMYAKSNPVPKVQ